MYRLPRSASDLQDSPLVTWRLLTVRQTAVRGGGGGGSRRNILQECSVLLSVSRNATDLVLLAKQRIIAMRARVLDMRPRSPIQVEISLEENFQME